MTQTKLVHTHMRALTSVKLDIIFVNFESLLLSSILLNCTPFIRNLICLMAKIAQSPLYEEKTS